MSEKVHSIGKRPRWKDLSLEDQEWLKKEHPDLALELIFAWHSQDDGTRGGNDEYSNCD